MIERVRRRLTCPTRPTVSDAVRPVRPVRRRL